jgi:hypothetical protein
MKKLHSRILPLILIATGCASQAPRPVRQAPPKAMPIQHEVKYKGETLSKIAAWYTGSPDNWSEIAAYNRHINPNSLVMGTIITIPEELLVKREPLEQQFVIRKTPRSTTIATRRTTKVLANVPTQNANSARAQLQLPPQTESSATSTEASTVPGETAVQGVPTPQRRQEVLDELLD